MKKFVLLVLCALPLSGQGTPFDVFVAEKLDRGLAIHGNITPVIGNDGDRCIWDYGVGVNEDSPASLARMSTRLVAETTQGGNRTFCVLYNLDPGKRIYLIPQTSDSSKTLWSSSAAPCLQACTNCGPSGIAYAAANSGFNCDGAGEFPYVVMNALDSDPTPDPPVHAGLRAAGAITGGGGHSYSIANDCSTLASQKAAAEADAGDGDTVELVGPAGIDCPVSNFTMPVIANDGFVNVRSNAPDVVLPPAGNPIDETYRDKLFGLTWSTFLPTSADGNGNLRFAYAPAAGARGYSFTGVYIGPPKLDDPVLAPVQMTITGINEGTDVVTVSSIPAAVVNGNAVIVNLEGTGVRGANGTFLLCNKSGNTFQLRTGATGCTGTVANLVGTYDGSGGTVTRIAAHEIESWQDAGDGTQGLTITDHGLPNFPTMTITGVPATNQVTVSGTTSEYQLGNGQMVMIEGNSGTNCNDVVWKGAVSGNTVTLSHPTQTPNCTPSTLGTIRRIKSVMIYKTNKDELGDHEPRSHPYSAVDANNIKLLGVPAVAGASGGYLFLDMRGWGATFAVNSSDGDPAAARRGDFLVDRSYLGKCFPWMGSAGAFNASYRVTVANSILEQCDIEIRPVVSDVIEAPFTQDAYIEWRRVEDFQLLNTRIFPKPVMFADDATFFTADRASMDDVSLKKSTFWWRDEYVGSHPARGIYFNPNPYLIEVKNGGNRWLIEGLQMKGWWSAFAAAQSALEMTLQGARGTAGTHPGVAPKNVDVAYNVLRDGNSGFYFAASSRPADRLLLVTQKIRVRGNLRVGTDTMVYTDDPGDNNGFFFGMNRGVVDLTVEENTDGPHRARLARFWDFPGAEASSGLRVRNNIIGAPGGGNTNQMGFQSTAPANELPARPATSGGLAAFEEASRTGSDDHVDPLLDLGGNFILPMITNSPFSDFSTKAASAAAGDNHCQSSLSALANFTGLSAPDWTYIGNANNPCDQSTNQRLALTFGTEYRPLSPTYDGSGAPIDTIEEKIGRVGPVAATGNANSFTLSFRSFQTAECYVDYAECVGGTCYDVDNWRATWAIANAANITRGQTANGATRDKTFTASGLSQVTEYAYKIWCGTADNQGTGKIGVAKTAGT